MSARSRVQDYYEALRRGDPLPPYFASARSGDEGAEGGGDGAPGGTVHGRGDAPVVKYGIGERLVGYGAVAAGLREQTRTTADWTVESSALRVTERRRHAWFSDEVYMAWTDLAADRNREFETRWSGTLERRDGEWLFVGMHVSVPHRIGTDDTGDDGTGGGDGRTDATGPDDRGSA